MSETLDARSRKWLSFSPHLIVVLAISMMIVALRPLDDIFSAITFGSGKLRMVAVAAIIFTGYDFAKRAGLRLEPHGTRSPILIALAGAILVAIYVTAIDCFFFRSIVPQQYVTIIRGATLLDRYIYFMQRAFLENVIYRLFAFSSLFYLLSRLRLASERNVLLGMIAIQCLNIGVNIVANEAISLPLLVYDALRYVAPGTLWAMIYRRFGFSTAEIASVGCHIFLQPMLGMAL